MNRKAKLSTMMIVSISSNNDNEHNVLTVAFDKKKKKSILKHGNHTFSSLPVSPFLFFLPSPSFLLFSFPPALLREDPSETRWEGAGKGPPGSEPLIIANKHFGGKRTGGNRGSIAAWDEEPARG